jgi:hypothetical protein
VYGKVGAVVTAEEHGINERCESDDCVLMGWSQHDENEGGATKGRE